ncbi:MAG TPA: hypothetical protein PK282_08725 [Rhodoglobus sp.]|jgi:hypothetical protein|nr:hypothetical protein [Rhodoglobus sp.]HOY81984.1 hypothetical protein [Rhodoglobus sp.]HPM52305.1 hypothetical protein [Rhodoglobus sp.]HQI65438.1 hypothetical protein [Rhodoglobus sp.]HQJ34479.1 hypothetical protein [Rhodoglobus sp.]
MKLYSDFGPRRSRQIVADVTALALIGAWVWLGITVYSLIENLAVYGVQMEDAGAGFRETMTQVGETLGGIPLIGGGIRTPFDGASEAGGALEAAGQSQQVAINQLATVLGIGIAALPILTILLLWLLPRLRFAQRASRAQKLVKSGAGVDLLALRALASQNISALAAVDPDAMAAWRRGDDQVMRKLAALELKSSGVRMAD